MLFAEVRGVGEGGDDLGAVVVSAQETMAVEVQRLITAMRMHPLRKGHVEAAPGLALDLHGLYPAGGAARLLDRESDVEVVSDCVAGGVAGAEVIAPQVWPEPRERGARPTRTGALLDHGAGTGQRLHVV